MAWARLLHPEHAGDVNLSIAFHTASQRFRDLMKFHPGPPNNTTGQVTGPATCPVNCNYFGTLTLGSRAL